MFTPYAASRPKRLLARMHAALTGGPKAHRVPARWVRSLKATDDGPVCVFVLLARGTAILPHSLDHARAWRDVGFRIVAAVVVDSLDDAVDLSPLDFADAVLLRVNQGYDFGAWAAAIRSLRPTLDRVPMLAIANDSVLGPSSNFTSVVERAAQSDADLVGLVETKEKARHFQSFALIFKQRAIRSRAFRKYWSSIRTGGREYVIENYEVTMRGRFEAAGLRTEALYPVRDTFWYNPTIIGWRSLVSAGFPFLKIELLRNDPWDMLLNGWREHAVRHGFDMDKLQRQIAALEELGPARWAYRDAEAG